MTDDAHEERTRRTLEVLRSLRVAKPQLSAAKTLVKTLRDARKYELAARVAEAVSRIDPRDKKNRCLYAQSLIETGRATVALDVLRAACRGAKGDELEELRGLIGRAYKQIFDDATDRTSPAAVRALRAAVEAYRERYDATGNTWHGVNLLALVHVARRYELAIAPDLDVATIARAVLAKLDMTPPERRDAWHAATVAEASLALGDWDAVESSIHAYAAEAADPFPIASTLRQLTRIWGFDEPDADPRGRGLLEILRARLLQLPGQAVAVRTVELQHGPAEPSGAQLEAVLGRAGAPTYRWWKTGIDRALAVAVIRIALGDRVGSGFLVRAADLGLSPAAEPLLLTNFHVVNEKGARPGIRADDAEVIFEAVDPNVVYRVAEIVWSSPRDRHDAAVLRLSPTPPADLQPLPLARVLPVIDADARVYIIGYVGGRELAFSMHDNELVDHEGPPDGTPPIPGVCRVHYRAPTEGGSSGSPVFNQSLWQVIALHHAGGKIGVPKLNGKIGTYGANEGIAIDSIVAAIKASVGATAASSGASAEPICIKALELGERDGQE